jgi:transcriptional regulator with XRE-family HTH domain
MTNRLAIIDSLEAARKAQGLTQEELASRAGTSRITVGRVEAGFDPKLATVYEMARALGLELMVVPKGLAGEVQAFIQSGGRVLAQPSGAGAPDSVVAQALAVSAAAHRASDAVLRLQKNEFTASNLEKHLSGRATPAASKSQSPAPTVRSKTRDGLFPSRIGANWPGPGSMGVGPLATKGPSISPEARERLKKGITTVDPVKGGKR